jgi:hypothetical protein
MNNLEELGSSKAEQAAILGKKNLGMKKGLGKVKKGYKKGGAVKHKGDGIAQRGRTKGRIV